MLKNVALFAALISVACSTPALADGDSGNPWADANNGDAQGHVAAHTDRTAPYFHETGGVEYSAPYRQTQQTRNGATQKMQSLGGVGTGAPYIFKGINTGYAFNNLAIQTEKGAKGAFGGKLPKTTLDSFVWKAMQNGPVDMIYGDEGTDGPPPYSDFAPIQAGGVQATTGHKSDAPFVSTQ